MYGSKAKQGNANTMCVFLMFDDDGGEGRAWKQAMPGGLPALYMPTAGFGYVCWKVANGV